MTFLPIVTRELLVRARQPMTYRVRWLAAGLALLVALPPLLGTSPNQTRAGQQLFISLSLLAFAFCLFEGARQTADCLSAERREGTLGLLFLTDLKGYDIVLGKLAAASVNSFYSLLALMPVLGLPVLAGGVTGGEFGRMTLVLAQTLFLALAIGMWVSSRSREEMKSLFTTLGLLAAMTVLPVLLDLLLHWHTYRPSIARISLGSPGFACFLAFDSAYRISPHLFWLSLGLLQAMSWGLLLAAAWKVQRAMGDEMEPVRARDTKTQTVPGPDRKAERRRRLLEKNPIQWLASRPRGVWLWVWLAAGAMVFGQMAQLLFYRVVGVRTPMMGWGLWGYSQPLVSFGVRFLIAFLACRFFSEARRNGTLELLLCTPLSRAEILQGQHAALWRLLLGPLVGAVALQMLLVFGPGIGSFSAAGLILYGGGRLLAILADALALAWFGAWAALNARRPAMAVAQTFLLVTILPWILCTGLATLLYGTVGLTLFSGSRSLWSSLPALLQPGLPLLLDALFILWARRKLRAKFCGGE